MLYVAGVVSTALPRGYTVRADMDALPPSEQQNWLLDGLATLVARCGPEPLLKAPIIEPTAAFFPDPLSSDVAGVRALASRLLAYAGLGALGVRVETYRGGGAGTPERSCAASRTSAAWFAGIELGQCRLGVDTATITRPGDLLSAMSHEIAHAFREHHGLRGEQAANEEALADLTAVYLGFGVLMARAEHVKGALSPSRLDVRDVCFLLGAQLVARGSDTLAREHLASYLDPNHAAVLRAACTSIARPSLLVRLGLDDSRVPEIVSTAAIRPQALVGGPLENTGLPVFRLRSGRTLPYAVLAVLAASVFCAVFLPARAPRLLVAALLALACALGALAGRLLARDVCSDPECGSPLRRRERFCPRCGGEIRGVIHSSSERAAAERRLARKARRRSGVPVSALDAAREIAREVERRSRPPQD